MILGAASEPVSLAQGHARQSIISESVCLLLTVWLALGLFAVSFPLSLKCQSMVVMRSPPSREIFGVSLQKGFGLASSFNGNLAWLSLEISQGREGGRRFRG